jgi:predicted RNA-binding Zn-ribbon protein involved in translation (DUF1610 family)
MEPTIRRLTNADNLFIATLWLNILSDAGISCELRNRFIGAASGEIPPDQVSPQLWVIDDQDYPAALALLKELRRSPNLPSWKCPNCGQVLEGQFYQCWNCQTERSTPEAS